MNAFHMMMNSRNKSLGQNEDGCEVDLKKSDSVVEKLKMKERRSLLENWADKKGAAKRKREYEELGAAIEHKLVKRGRRLKQMLNVECESDDEVIRKVRKKGRVVSDSENSNEGAAPVLTKKSVKNWKCKIKLSMQENEEKLKTISKEAIEDDENILFEENEEPVEPSGRVLRSRKSKPKYYEDPDFEVENSKRKSTKLAPVFLKSVPKPKIDPEVLKARRQFLMSGVPSSLKKEIEKQQIFEENFETHFPKISHVQQKSPENHFWDLPKPDFKFIEETTISDFTLAPTETITKLLDLVTLEKRPSKSQGKIKSIKNVIKEIKNKNPNYPVNKMFNTFKKDEKIRQKNTVWTEKYKSKMSSDIIGNQHNIKSLKEWLSDWSNKKNYSSSESEFEENSRDSFAKKSVGNTVLVKGPVGCGKTSAIYTICNELGYEILEVNASNRRTGKRLLRELQEATQSHQVRKQESTLSTFIQEKKKDNKMCVLLIEDIDIVYEQDEGFLSALSEIILTSKRPVILTTTGNPTGQLQKIVQNKQVFSFSQLSTSLTVWLQVVCAMEGFKVIETDLETILTVNRRDIRRTLLQLQILLTSGEFNVTVGEPDLETIWWNSPTILQQPNFSKTRLERIVQSEETVTVNKKNFLKMCQFYDTLSTADVISSETKPFYTTLDNRWRCKPKDGLGVDDSPLSYQDNFLNELAMTLVKGVTNDVKINMAAPSFVELRWRAKQLSCEEKLYDALSLGDFLERKSLVLDYVPVLRTIVRSESERAANNTKRRNRFYHYLRDLNVKCSDMNYKTTCDVFKPWF